MFKIGIGNDLRDILEVAWFWIEGSKVKVRVRVFHTNIWSITRSKTNDP